MRILLLILVPLFSFSQGDYEKIMSGWVKYKKRNITGRGVKVAVLDNGLAEAVIPTFYKYDFAEGDEGVNNFNHGTYISSIIKDDSIGVAPGVDLYFLKIYDDGANFVAAAAVEALRYCYNNDIDIVNISWSQGLDPAMEDIIDSLIDNDCIIVAASGNSTTEAAIGYPAQLDGVLAVNAIKSDGSAFYLNVNGGHGIDLAASGFAIDVINVVGQPEINSGTSFSAPWVCGALALLMEEFPNRSNRDVLQHLLNKVAKAEPALYFGRGRVKL